MESVVIDNIAAFTLAVVVSVLNRQRMVKTYAAIPTSYTLSGESAGSQERGTAISLLTKLPATDHSCCNLVRSDAKSSGVHAMESSPYKVKDDKVLLCQGRVVAVVGSSFIRAPSSRPKSVIPS
jgi:hypothetical protein